MKPMKTNTLQFAFSLLLALPAVAQDKKPEPAPAPKPAPAAAPKPAAERPKDDPVTAKDPAIVAMDKFIETKGPAKKEGAWKTMLTIPPKLTFTKDFQYEWHMKTNKGEITIRLMPDVAPMHVSSTIYLARLGFYDNLSFHRVIPGFMAQGGDPLGNGSGGPGYKYEGEFDPKVVHDKPGRLSMANAGPGTDGSQFFLTFVPTMSLNGKHSIFGEITNGMDVLKALEAAGTPGGKPTEPLTIEMTWIVVKPAATPAAAPEKKEEPATPPKKKEGGY
jgi:cyclophilin family peptidyl-prolyl cis-trans isomerase